MKTYKRGMMARLSIGETIAKMAEKIAAEKKASKADEKESRGGS